MRRMLTLAAGMTAVIAIAACGGGLGGGQGITIINGSISYFLVRGSLGNDTVSVAAGQTADLHGTAYDGGFNPIALLGDTAWRSNDTSVAKVDEHGEVTTFRPGSTWVVGVFTPKSSQVSYADSVFLAVFGPI